MSGNNTAGWADTGLRGRHVVTDDTLGPARVVEPARVYGADTGVGPARRHGRYISVGENWTQPTNIVKKPALSTHKQLS